MKVKLLLEDLHVESFEVQSESLRTGTVWGLEFGEDSGVHSDCYTHCVGCPTEPMESVVQTHCDRDCPSWDGSCGTGGGTTIEA